MHNAYDFSGISREEAFPQTQGLEGVSAFIQGLKQIFIEQASRQMKDILELLQEFPADLLLGDDLCFGLGFAREKTGIPLVNITNSIYNYSSRDAAPPGLALLPDNSIKGRVRNTLLSFVSDNIVMRELKTSIDKARASCGLDKINKSNIFERISQPPDLYLLGTIPKFEYPRSDLYKNAYFVGALISPSLEHFNPPQWWNELYCERPVVLVTQGTVSNNNPNDLIVPTIRALAQEDMLVVVTTGTTSEDIQFSQLPDNVRVERFIPYHFLLPHIDVMVTNGG